VNAAHRLAEVQHQLNGREVGFDVAWRRTQKV
jgi:hypothetical protein